MRKLAPSLLLGAAAVSLLAPARAVELEQKWQPGQKLGYDMALEGTLNMQAAPDVPLIIAGIPLEVQVKGRGEGQLETLTVDESGTGTVAVKVPKINLQAETFGQKVDVQVADGKPSVKLNGKAMNLGLPKGGEAPAAPPIAVKINRQGKLTGIDSAGLKPKALPTNPNTDTPVPVGEAIDRAALVQALVLRAIPALWPGRDVQPGESWEAIVPWTQPNGTDTAKPLGQFKLTLKGEETVEGRVLQRVEVDGGLQLDAEKLKQINVGVSAANKNRPQPMAGTLTAAGQKIKGDLWFDAKAGQIHKAELVLNSRMAGRTQKPGGATGGESWADFTGTLQLNLKNPA